jgi:thymidine phosphorylase
LLIPEIIQKKRDGHQLSVAEIRQFIEGVTSNEVTDAQIAAFSMAAYFQDFSTEERTDLTLSMRDSGQVIDWRSADINGPLIDKHSTGGVGDTVSFLLAPLLAACGGFVPMIAGRGLAHTGGTIDKLESIPGYNTGHEIAHFKRVVAETGMAIVGQTTSLAPADQRMYATRDVTATVEQYGLITASILSKKLAAGLESLVMDIKVGNGAFMSNPEVAWELAKSLCSVGTAAGMPTTALLTDMNQPLANTAGNALEVSEAIGFLTGTLESNRLRQVTWGLASQNLVLSGLVPDEQSARVALDDAHRSGRAAEIFERSIHGMGGAADVLTSFERLGAKAPIIRPLIAPESWHGQTVLHLNTRQLGLAIVALGGGRTYAGQAVDHSVGCSDWIRPGELCEPEKPLAVIHARNESGFEAAAQRILEAIAVGEELSYNGTDVIIKQFKVPGRNG